jgi:putative ABC transport system substrate-binding protein
VLHAKGDPNVVHAIDALEKNAPGLGVQIFQYEVASPTELPVIFKQMKESGADGVVSVAGAFTFNNSEQIGQLTLQERLPSVHGFKDTVASGGLMSLGPNMTSIAISGAGYVDRVLRGANPGDLPVQQPTQFEIAINLKTAKTLGLTVPPSILVSADEVIE